MLYCTLLLVFNSENFNFDYDWVYKDADYHDRKNIDYELNMLNKIVILILIKIQMVKTSIMYSDYDRYNNADDVNESDNYNAVEEDDVGVDEDKLRIVVVRMLL